MTVLTISANQQKAFEQIARARFEDEMVVHSKHLFSKRCELIGDEALRLALRSAIRRAEAYGFTNRGPIRLFIELSFLCGSRFDTDPQYRFFEKILREPSDQMVRAEKMHDAHNLYLQEVSGINGSNESKTVEKLSQLVQESVLLNKIGFEANVQLWAMQNLPEKFRYLGEEGLIALVQHGKVQATKLKFNQTRQVALIVALMILYGHGCTSDPFQPWISRYLHDRKTAGEKAIADQPEQSAIALIDLALNIPTPESN